MIHTVCICGAGTMGTGIAQAIARSGFYTIIYDLNNQLLEKARAVIDQNLQRLVEKGNLSAAAKSRIMQQIVFTGDLHCCLADIVIEAIIEKADAKVALFNQLAEINHSETVFATNTSSLSITAIAKRIMSPGRVIGMHFFNPAAHMQLVEVITTPYTSQATKELVLDLAAAIGKTAVVCLDRPGFIVNRVARPFYIESLRMLEQNEADIATIDSLLEATGFRMGPFKLMDLIGNDINYAVSSSVYDQLLRPARLRPSPIQKDKVDKAELGKKTGKGYYDYPRAIDQSQGI